MISSQWRHLIKGFNEVAVVPEQEWNDNTVANIPRLHKSNSIWNLQGLFIPPNDKAVVIVGASPRLKQDVEKLKECNDEFRIFCVNSALKYLLKHDIKPHYVVAMDSDDADIYDHLDVDSKDLTLIAGSSLSPRVLDHWKGAIWYLPYYGCKKELRPKVRGRLGKSIPIGGNCVNTIAVASVIVLKARILILVGTECCYEKNYYVSKDIVRNNAEPIEFNTYDVDGNPRTTTMALHTYKLWLEKFAHKAHPVVKIIDTSFGIMGKRDEKSAIYVYELSEIIRKVKEASEKKKEIIRNAKAHLLNTNVYPEQERGMSSGAC